MDRVRLTYATERPCRGLHLAREPGEFVATLDPRPRWQTVLHTAVLVATGLLLLAPAVWPAGTTRAGGVTFDYNPRGVGGRVAAAAFAAAALGAGALVYRQGRAAFVELRGRTLSVATPGLRGYSFERYPVTAEEEVGVELVADEHCLMLRDPHTGDARYPLSTANGTYDSDQLERLAAAICEAQEVWG